MNNPSHPLRAAARLVLAWLLLAAALPAVAQPAVGQPAAAQPAEPDRWPHSIQGPDGSALIYQPQVITWPDRQTLNTRIALSITPAGSKAAVLGTVEASFATSTDLAARQVTLSNAKLVSSRFPAADTAQAERFDQRIRAALAAMPPKRVPLDMVLLSLRSGGGETPASVPVQHAPPVIFYSARPASLLLFDGEPVLAPVAGTPLSVAVNTNWDVFVDGAAKTWYWLNNGSWLSAADVKGPWAPAGALPAAFSSLPDDRNFADVRKQIPGRSLAAADMPQVFVSTTPAEIIVTQGAPQYTAIAGTQLQYVANTDAPLFRHQGNGLTYFLVAGRWFSAPSLQGPWTFATAQLPADFARIPPNSPRGFVLASVPGTVQAQEALIHAQIPQQATLDKASARIEVVYAGAPKFEPIPGTGMAYAVNTSFNVVRVDNAYWACHQGAWFTAPAPTGRLGAGAQRARGDLHHPAGQPAVPLHLRARLRRHAHHRDLRLHGRLHDGLHQRRRRRLRHRLVLPALLLPGADPDLLPVPGDLRRGRLVQPGHGGLGTRRRGLWPVLRRARRHRLQPGHGRLCARRLGLRPLRRRGRVLGLQPQHRQLCPWQRGLRPRRRGRQRQLVQRTHGYQRLDAAERQCLQPLGVEHDLGPEPDGAHAKPERCARLGGIVQLQHRRRRGGRARGRRQQRRCGQDRRWQRLCRRRRQRLQEDRQRLAEVRQRVVELGAEADHAARPYTRYCAGHSTGRHARHAADPGADRGQPVRRHRYKAARGASRASNMAPNWSRTTRRASAASSGSRPMARAAADSVAGCAAERCGHNQPEWRIET